LERAFIVNEVVNVFKYGLLRPDVSMEVIMSSCHGVKSSQVANPRNAFCIEQRATAKSKEARVRVFGLFLLLPRLAPVGLIAR
jgi:hypothetical protein